MKGIYTKMINAAICDDNEPTLSFLSRKISDIFSDNGVNFNLQQFHSGEDFIKIHENSPFDVVFMDIVMPDMNGFEVAKKIREISKETYLIFITTESSLVYDSFDFQPFYFIPKGKPQVVEDRLRHVVGKLALLIAAQEKIFINGAYENKFYVSPNEILYIKSSSNQVTFYFIDKKTVQIRNKLSDLLDTLNQYVFVRTHNRIVVNMKHIERVDYPNMEILLDSGDVIPISRSCKDIFKNAYTRFTRNFS